MAKHTKRLDEIDSARAKLILLIHSAHEELERLALEQERLELDERPRAGFVIGKKQITKKAKTKTILEKDKQDNGFGEIEQQQAGSMASPGTADTQNKKK